MPKPNPNESRSKFVSRCIPIVESEPGTKSTEHAIAKCHGMWEQNKKQNRGEANSEKE